MANIAGITATPGKLYFALPSEILVNWAKNEVRQGARPSDESFENLMQSIRETGRIIEPVVCVKGDGKPEVHVGFRRVTAAQLLEQRMRDEGVGEDSLIRVPFTLTRYENEGAAFLEQLGENHERENLSPSHLAHCVARVQRLRPDLGMDAIGKKFFGGRSAATLSNYLKYLDLAPEYQAALDEGSIKPDAALALAEVPAEHRAEVLQAAEQITKEQAASGNKQASGKRVTAPAVKKAAQQKGLGKNKKKTGPLDLQGVKDYVESKLGRGEPKGVQVIFRAFSDMMKGKPGGFQALEEALETWVQDAADVAEEA